MRRALGCDIANTGLRAQKENQMTTMNNPGAGKPFTPGKPTTYTPHSKPTSSQPDSAAQSGASSAQDDRRPGAPQRPDVPNRANPPEPIDMGEGIAGPDEETKAMSLEDLKPSKALDGAEIDLDDDVDDDGESPASAASARKGEDRTLPD